MATLENRPLSALLAQIAAEGGYPTDDVLRVILPLFEQAQVMHTSGKVAPLEGIAHLRVNEDGEIWFSEADAPEPKIKWFGLVSQNFGDSNAGVDVVAESARVTEFGEERISRRNEDVSEQDAIARIPQFLQGYVCWEHHAGQHDPLTDIFSLGLLLASVACGLDLAQSDDFELFRDNRTYLFAINSRLNPVIAAVIMQMTELDRHRRAQDLPSLIRRLRAYREQPTEFDTDFRRLAGFQESSATGRRRLIQTHLRNRLFEISRRNRLLYFRASQKTVNLTLASVPAVLDFRHIRLDQLFVWHRDLAGLLAKQTPIPLNRFVRFEDAPYVPELLDKIIADTRRDRAEYGFSQLKLVLCFLRWNNLKEAPQERIISPLLLLPAELTKKKGVRDSFHLAATSSTAEINPALRQYLRQTYDLKLPDTLELGENAVEDFYSWLAQQIQASEPAVTLRKVEKPQIEIIHQKARQRLDQFRRRQRNSVGKETYAKLDYSYRANTLKPLGLQIFLQKVRPPESPFSDVLGDGPARKQVPEFIVPEQAASAPRTKEKTRTTYSVKEPEDANPYLWSFDLCNFTLGNFNYRKMSLVSDYNQIIEQDAPHPAFDRIFSLEPKPSVGPTRAETPLADQFAVVACDPTQAEAIARAREGESLIIQGPPGTGKSQTITNLIADFMAQGKRVLFVCEKRAAIDVVFHRLRQQGLDEYCCLIHDAQADKKAFVQELKGSYEKLLASTSQLPAIEEERAAVLRELEIDRTSIARFEAAMAERPTSAGIPVQELLHRMAAVREHSAHLEDAQQEALPAYTSWRAHGHHLRRLEADLRELGEDRRWTDQALRWINPAFFQNDQPFTTIGQAVQKSRESLERLTESLTSLAALEGHLQSPLKVAIMLEFARRVQVLAERNLLGLLHPESRETANLQKQLRAVKKSESAVEKAVRNALAWVEKLGPEDTAMALADARRLEPSLLRWLQPAWWRLFKLIRQRYDRNRHPVRRSVTVALQELQSEYDAVAALEALKEEIEAGFGTNDLPELLHEIDRLRSLLASAPPELRKVEEQLRRDAAGAGTLVRLLHAGPVIERDLREIGSLLLDIDDLLWPDIGQRLDAIRADFTLVRNLLPALRGLREVSEDLGQAFRGLPLSTHQLEAAIARKSLQDVYRDDRFTGRFDGTLLREKRARLAEHHASLLRLNARLIAARWHERFLERASLSELPAAQLEAAQKLLKKSYSSGRRELEHEFGKTMRFKSIRELASGVSGQVLADLRPVWLMSPLSVSDSLTLDASGFDVVIFDEASQIPVEDAIPALYRAPQVIVVGDEKQLPPTRFFSGNQDEEEELVVEEEDEKVTINLEADSLLAQSAINLPATMLGWHYRSRSEALIGFSNAAFYNGGLLTVPDRQLPRPGQKEIIVEPTDDHGPYIDQLLERSLSFHFHSAGLYEDRRNRPEADYIAQLVRGLLLRNTGRTIGIVAFSEAQQGEIENALRRLGQADPAFNELFEKEQEREEDGQFCGLFVKNLENVQGDERDIIILSVCYGYDRNRRMLMNFGPINQQGGEKRLNVIFSRAREHMAVVTSIRASDIRNEYNDGANSLRLFLHYAEAFSRGDHESARRILTGLGAGKKQHADGPSGKTANIVLEQLATGLRERGLQVDVNVGQSHFRIDLAIRHAVDPRYCLAIFVDDADCPAASTLLERHLLRPEVLRAFGWRVEQVLAKDWVNDSSAVLDHLCRAANEDVLGLFHFA